MQALKKSNIYGSQTPIFEGSECVNSKARSGTGFLER